MAGYFPLFRKFLDSSIMDEDVEVRFLFLTMILKADRDGFVEATDTALARASALKLVDVQEALVILQAPDARSTTTDDDGRRIAEVSPNRWLILNYDKYVELARADAKKKDNAAAARRYRERQKASSRIDDDEMTVDDGDDFDDASCDRHQSSSVSGSVSILGKKEGGAGGRKGVTPKSQKVTKFVPPTVEEVQEYIDSKSLPVDAEYFVDFYQSKGWMVGKNKMKDWQAACRRAKDWEHNLQKFGVRGDYFQKELALAEKEEAEYQEKLKRGEA